MRYLPSHRNTIFNATPVHIYTFTFTFYSAENFSPQLISDVKSLLNVLTVLIPVPVFWALFDQQTSRWTYQAINMERRIYLFGSQLIVQPDMIQALNSVFVITLIPLFQFLIYPLVNRFYVLKPVSISSFFFSLFCLLFSSSSILFSFLFFCS